MKSSEISLSIKPRSVKINVAAKILDTSERVVRNLIDCGYIRAMRFPALTISIKELDRFIDYATENQIDFSEFGSIGFNKEKSAERESESNLVQLKNY